MSKIPKGTIWPPPGKPSLGGGEGLPLVYLGWGKRDFFRNPVAFHYDRGTHFFLLLAGEIRLRAGDQSRRALAPAAMIIDVDCPFGIGAPENAGIEILVWVWQGRPALAEVRPETGGFAVLPLRPQSIPSLTELHARCRAEVALADGHAGRTLSALRDLVEAEIARATGSRSATGDVRWQLAHAWMARNLTIHAPVPALCDYLRMSPSTLHRFFREHVGTSPGNYFRRMKADEARRLIREEGWQVKAAAYHLGYRHPNDLSRALGSSVPKSRKPTA